MKRTVLLLSLLGGCTEDISAAEYGGRLFADKHGISKSSSNDVSCATCHQTSASPDPNRLDSGYNLYGVAARASYWGGQADTLIEAVSTCVVYFMRATTEPDPESEEMRALWEFLTSITPEDARPDPLPMTVVEDILAVPFGDEARGCDLYDRGCVRCHGDLHTGNGKIDQMAITLPEDALRDYPEMFPGFPPGLVVIEKLRHGRFFNTPGVMPLFSLEALSDTDVGDMLACLGLSAEE